MPWGGYNEDAVQSIKIPSEWRTPMPRLAEVDSLMNLRFADAEQAKSTGGMVALFPRIDDALQMQVPGGEDVSELHVTLCYLGEDVSDMDPGQLSIGLSQIADSYTSIEARVMGHATFNGDGGPNGDMDPCAVYLVSDAPELDQLHKDVLDLCQQEFQVPTQHAPYIPHITAGYGLDANRLTFHGPVTFDRIGMRFAGQSRDFHFIGG